MDLLAKYTHGSFSAFGEHRSTRGGPINGAPTRVEGKVKRFRASTLVVVCRFKNAFLLGVYSESE